MEGSALIYLIVEFQCHEPHWQLLAALDLHIGELIWRFLNACTDAGVAEPEGPTVVEGPTVDWHFVSEKFRQPLDTLNTLVVK